MQPLDNVCTCTAVVGIESNSVSMCVFLATGVGLFELTSAR